MTSIQAASPPAIYHAKVARESSPEASSSADGSSEASDFTGPMNGGAFRPAPYHHSAGVPAEDPFDLSLPIFGETPEDIASFHTEHLHTNALVSAGPAAVPASVGDGLSGDVDFDFEEFCRAMLSDSDANTTVAATNAVKPSEKEGDFQPSDPGMMAILQAAAPGLNAAPPPPGDAQQSTGHTLQNPSRTLQNPTSPSSYSGSPAVSDDKDETGWSETHSAVSSRRGHLKRGRASSTRTSADGTETVEHKTREQIEEERLQKRLAKNRRTAAESRERKKAAMGMLHHEVESLRQENTKLKQALEVQTMHTQLLREELASLTRGAKRDSTAASTAEPAELITTNITPPLVHNTFQLQSVPGSSVGNVLNALSIVALLYLAGQTAGTIIGAASSISTDPHTIHLALEALSQAKLASSGSAAVQPQTRCSSQLSLPWQQQLHNPSLSVR
mmetsp:Transcript_19035/g.53052  ORF Transcript_19035/g.53052 Transcript_19035/m.53052 type:complete len:446 (-) Transcript_19035:874-2211(-)